MIPSFRHMGGKARLRKWLISHFPAQADMYLEPFCGKGNVYYAACDSLFCFNWILADIDGSFLTALQTANLNELPETVEKADFSFWRNSSSPIATLIEPRITFAGKGYRYGFSGSSGTHVGYNGALYKKVCEQARTLLKNALIITGDWETTIQYAQNEAFVYLDPPYYATDACYPNIDHSTLIDCLNAASFKWALSGYDNELYRYKLKFKTCHKYERNSEIKSSNTGMRTPVIECLWTNYSIEEE